MKVIISHDVDHLFRDDHYKDLIYPKLWVRSSLELIKRKYGVREWFYRMLNPFSKKRHHIPEIIAFDKKNGIESTFFFGMATGLGMSYSLERAKPVIHYVVKQGFDVGVHGIAYNDEDKIQEEYERMRNILGREDFGIRTHYVRFDETTFPLFNKSGYLFDTSEFNKTTGYCLKAPYKIGEMWEFPLVVMDGYLPLKLEEKKKASLKLIKKAEQQNLPYLTILFHDYQLCEGYATEREWYKWLIEWLKANNYQFISYKDAITELNGER